MVNRNGCVSRTPKTTQLTFFNIFQFPIFFSFSSSFFQFFIFQHFLTFPREKRNLDMKTPMIGFFSLSCVSTHWEAVTGAAASNICPILNFCYDIFFWPAKLYFFVPQTGTGDRRCLCCAATNKASKFDSTSATEQCLDINIGERSLISQPGLRVPKEH